MKLPGSAGRPQSYVIWCPEKIDIDPG